MNQDEKTKLRLIEAFKNNPDVQSLFLTKDGTVFFSENTASAHDRRQPEKVSRMAFMYSAGLNPIDCKPLEEFIDEDLETEESDKVEITVGTGEDLIGDGSDDDLTGDESGEELENEVSEEELESEGSDDDLTDEGGE